MISEGAHSGAHKSHDVLIALNNSIHLRLKAKSIDIRCKGRRVSSVPIHVVCGLIWQIAESFR